MLERSIKLLHRFWFGSIYRQVMMAFALSTAVLVFVFGSSLIRLEHEFLDDSRAGQARDIAHSLSLSSAPYIKSEDRLQLQRLVDSAGLGEGLRYVHITAPDGHILASTRPAAVGQMFQDLPAESGDGRPELYPQMLTPSGKAIAASAPAVMSSGELVGWVRVGARPAVQAGTIRAISSHGLLMVGVAFIMIVLVALAISSRVSGGLRELMRTMNLVLNGRRDVRADATREDELGLLARNFNGMLDSLVESERKLERLNRFYAAWTRSNEILVRETDEQRLLERICQTMAECVPFKLVWVGMADVGGWVRVAAASDPYSAYLREHAHISVDADRPEGRVPMGITIREGKPQILNDFLQPGNALPWRAAAEAEQFRSVATFPLTRGGRCVGALGYYSTEPDFFRSELVALMQGLTEDVSFALDGFDHEARRREAETQLALAARVFDNSMEGIVITDAESRIISVNRGFTEITGYSQEEVFGKNPRILKSGQQDQQFYRAMWESLNTTGCWRGEVRNRRKNGEFYPEWLTISRVLDESGNVANYIGVFSDISERKLAEARIQHLAYFDALTDLPNRILLRDRLDQAIIKAQRASEAVTVLFLDLDRFKIVNDTLGHAVGDSLLKAVSQRLLACVREQDTVSRQGGDEFLAVLPDTDAEGAALVAQKILQALAAPCLVEGHELLISPSIGISLYPDDATDIEELIKLADAAMYHAKNQGRNNYQFCSALTRASA